MMKFAWAMAAMAIVLPVEASAQSVTAIKCMAEKASVDLKETLVDGFLAELPIEEQPAEVLDKLTNASAACSASNEIAEDQAQNFFSGNLSYLLAEGIKRRMAQINFDLAPTETMLVVLERDPSISIADYIDARPAEFQNPIENSAATNGISEDAVIAMLGGYIGMRLEQKSALERLVAR